MRTTSSVLAAAAFAIGTGAASAASVDSAASGLSAPTTSITFSEVALANGTSVTDQYAAFGVTFSPELTYLGSVSARPNFSGPALVNFGGQPFTTFDPFSIVFGRAVSAATFAFTTNGGTTTFASFLHGNSVEAFTSATDVSAQNFYGFTGSLFDEIRVTSSTAPRTAALDNLSFTTAVPVPAALPLMVGGLGVLLGMARRRGLRQG